MNHFHLNQRQSRDGQRECKPRFRLSCDATSERNDGTDFDETDVKNYVCIKCRRKMANEAFTTCDHLPAYCSECLSNLRNCPFCEAKANARHTTQQ